jgi:hypothetical protein
MIMSERYPHLLDERALTGPRFIGRLVMPGARTVAQNLNAHAAALAAEEVQEIPTAVIVHGQQGPMGVGRKRDTDPVRAERILDTARNLRAQKFGGDLVLATTVHADFGPLGRQLRRFNELDIQILRQDARMSHPEAIQVAAQQIGTEEGATVAIEAGNRFATDQALRTASKYVSQGAWGVFGPLVMDSYPSKLSYEILGGNSEYYKQEADPDAFPTANENGFMPDAGAAFFTGALLDNPLDTTFANGGSFRAWADNLQRRAGDIWYDPGMAVHDARAYGLHTGMLLDESLRLDDDN